VLPHSLTDLAGLRVSAEDFLAAVSETVAQPIWVVDPDDVIRFVNPAAIMALGYDSADSTTRSRRAGRRARHSHARVTTSAERSSPVSDENAVRSPIPGVFYRRPDPDSAPFVSEGDVVEDGGVVGLVEVMKQFHEVRSEVRGRVRSFAVDDEGVVSAGDVVAELDPAE
jgi:acetyl-CoA carboxylase biotin carboxyl carrier protein